MKFNFNSIFYVRYKSEEISPANVCYVLMVASNWKNNVFSNYYKFSGKLSLFRCISIIREAKKESGEAKKKSLTKENTK